MNFESDLPIIVVFPPYAGGKFVMNCLNLSQHVAPSHRGLIGQLLPQLDNYKLRLSAVMSTLPQPNDMLEWQNFEFQDEICSRDRKAINKPVISCGQEEWLVTGSTELLILAQMSF